MKSINPYNNKIIKEYSEFSKEQIQEHISQAHTEFFSWRDVSFEKRSQLFSQLADILEQDKTNLATLMSKEMGKPLNEGESEIEKCAWVCRYYADKAQEFLAPQKIESDFSTSEVHYSPLGVILAVMPWNYPFWQVFRFAAPNLMAGNTAVLKHASNVTGCALAIEDLFQKAGFPDHVFRTLVIKSDQVEEVIKNKYIRAVTLTGSTKAGQSVAKIAGENLKKTVLELGGSDPYIIMADADLENAAQKCVQSRLLNGGQSCISAKRFIVMSEVYDEFLNKLKSQMEKKKLGDPQDKSTDIGPMARVDLRDELHEQVQKTIEAGAKCVLGGTIPESEGAFYSPTILSEVKKGMIAYSEELFGPVATVIKVKNINEAIEIANDTSFGLGSAIFSKDTEEAKKIASTRIDSGACFINDFVKSDPRLPFGGVKESGYGRELSVFGIHEFVNIKTICIQ